MRKGITMLFLKLKFNRQNPKFTRKCENSPLKMNLNLGSDKLKFKKQNENMILEEDKIPHKLMKKM